MSDDDTQPKPDKLDQIIAQNAQMSQDMGTSFAIVGEKLTTLEARQDKAEAKDDARFEKVHGRVNAHDQEIGELKGRLNFRPKAAAAPAPAAVATAGPAAPAQPVAANAINGNLKFYIGVGVGLASALGAVIYAAAKFFGG